MALLDHLIEVFNSNNFFVPVSVCVVVGAILLFTVIKWLSKSDKRHKVALVDVDDWDKETQNDLKKTKQKKVKASSNAQADSGSNSSRSKVTGKQSAATKVTVPSAKEKQADEKPKSSAKKQVAASVVSSKSIQSTNEVQGEWTVAGSKKKQKNKKTVVNVKESKAKDKADRQTRDVEEVETRISVADIPPKDVEPSHEAQMESHEHETVFDAPTKASSQTEIVTSQLSKSSFDKLPASTEIEEPVAAESTAEARADEGNVESDPTGKESKHKKNSKKKKSKVVAEPAQGTDLAVQKAAVAPIRKEDGGQTVANIPSSSVSKPESAQHVETVRKPDAEPAKGTSKDMVAENTKIPDASKDVVKVASKGVVKVASKDVVPDASREVLPDPSKGIANEASKSTATDDSKQTVPVASRDGPASQLVVFDELGLQESSADVGQLVLKKKKKARKDI